MVNAMASTTAGVRIKREKMEVTILPKKEGGKCRVHHGIRFSRQVCMGTVCVVTSAAAASVADVNFPYFLFPISDHAYFLYMRLYTIPGGGGGGERRVLLLRLVTTTKEAGVDMDGQKRGSIENTLFRTQEISAQVFESEPN